MNNLQGKNKLINNKQLNEEKEDNYIDTFLKKYNYIIKSGKKSEKSSENEEKEEPKD